MRRPIVQLIEAGWLTLTEAKTCATLMDVEHLNEDLAAWQEARALADALRPPPGPGLK